MVLLQAKQRRIEELTAQKRAERPAHVQLRELEEKLDKKQRVLERQKSVIPELQEKIRKAEEEVAQTEASIRNLQAQKDELLRSPTAGEAADSGGATKALAALQALKNSMDGPGAAPFLQYLGPLEAEIAKFSELTPVDEMDLDSASIAPDDLDAEEQAEMDKIEGMDASSDGGKARRTAMLSFTRKVFLKKAKKKGGMRQGKS